MRRPPATSCSRYGKIDGLDMRDNVPPRRDAVNERREKQRFSGQSIALGALYQTAAGDFIIWQAEIAWAIAPCFALKNWLA
jgi:hypothetical protein